MDDQLFPDERHENKFVEPMMTPQERTRRIHAQPKINEMASDGQKETSFQAAISVRPKIGGIKKRIMELLDGRDGLTCSEISEALEKEKPSVSPRLVELERVGLLETAGTRPSNTGHQATIYRIKR